MIILQQVELLQTIPQSCVCTMLNSQIFLYLFGKVKTKKCRSPYFYQRWHIVQLLKFLVLWAVTNPSTSFLSLYRWQCVLFGWVRVAFITHVTMYCCNSADCVNLFSTRKCRKHWVPTPRWRCGFKWIWDKDWQAESFTAACRSVWLVFKKKMLHVAPLQNSGEKRGNL